MSFDLNNVDTSDTGVDKELKDFLMMEQKKAQFQSQVKKLTLIFLLF